MQANGETPEPELVSKLSAASEKLEKYQGLSIKAQMSETLHIQHQLTVLKYFLKTVKLGAMSLSDEIRNIVSQNLES